MSGFISGIRSAKKAKLCGAKWYIHVAGSITIGTVLGRYSGKIGSQLSDGATQAAGIFTMTTTTTKSFSLSLKVLGPDIATGIACGVSSTAAETVFLTAPEAATKAISDIEKKRNEVIESFGVEFDAHGSFQ